MLRRLPILLGPLLALTVMLAACRAGGDAPEVTRVRPSPVVPGSLLVLSGREFDQVAAISVDGRPLDDVTRVNDGTLAVSAPADLAPGEHQLELRDFEGRRTVALVNVAGTASAPASAVRSSPTPQAAVRSTPPPAEPSIRPAPVTAPGQAVPAPSPSLAPPLRPAATAAPSPVPVAPVRPVAPAPPPRATPLAPPPTRVRDNDDDDEEEQRERGSGNNGSGRGQGRR